MSPCPGIGPVTSITPVRALRVIRGHPPALRRTGDEHDSGVPEVLGPNSAPKLEDRLPIRDTRYDEGGMIHVGHREDRIVPLPSLSGNEEVAP